MNFKIRFAFFFAFLALSFSSYSQSKTINNVAKISYSQIGTIRADNSKVTGYYFFYSSDRLSRKVYSYQIDIIDQNLNPLASHTIKGSKELQLLEAKYNGNGLMVKLYDGKEKNVRFYTIGMDGKKKSSYGREPSKVEKKEIAAEGRIQGLNLYPIKNHGFLDYSAVKHKKTGFTISFYPTKVGQRRWKFRSSTSSTLHEIPSQIYADENVVICSVIKKAVKNAKKLDMYILGLDAKTGRKMYYKKVEDPSYELMVLNGFESDAQGNVYLFGTYFKKGEKEVSGKSLGLFSARVNPMGKVTEKSFVSWEKDISKFLPVNEKGKMKHVGYMYFHDIVRDADGNVYAIAEQYKKQADGLGIASRALGGSDAAVANMRIEDLMVFELDKDYNPWIQVENATFLRL